MNLYYRIFYILTISVLACSHATAKYVGQPYRSSAPIKKVQAPIEPEFNCKTDYNKAYNESRIAMGIAPKPLNKEDLLKASRFISLVQTEIFNSFDLSNKVVHDIQKCLSEMGDKWSREPGPLCRSLPDYEKRNYKKLIYIDTPNVFKTMRISLALASKPKEIKGNLPIWNWINKDLKMGSNWPTEVVEQEPLLDFSNPQQPDELSTAIDVFKEKLTTIVLDYLDVLKPKSDEDSLILYSHLVKVLEIDDANLILKHILYDLKKDSLVPAVNQWFSFFNRQMSDFRDEQLSITLQVIDLLRPIARLGKALPSPTDFSATYGQLLKTNEQVKDYFRQEQKKLMDLSMDPSLLYGMTMNLKKVEALDQMYSTYINSKNFVERVLESHPDSCEVAHFIKYRDQVINRNSTIEGALGTVALFASAWYVRPVVSLAVFLGIGVKDIIDGKEQVALQERFFQAQLTGAKDTDSFIDIQAVLDERSNLTMSYYLLPLNFVSMPLRKITGSFGKVTLNSLFSKVKNVKLISKSGNRKLYEFNGFDRKKGLLILQEN